MPADVLDLVTHRNEPVEGLVEQLESLLRSAKAGRLRSLAYSGSAFDDGGHVSVTGFQIGDGSIPDLIAGLELTKHRLVTAWSSGVVSLSPDPEDG